MVGVRTGVVVGVTFVAGLLAGCSAGAGHIDAGGDAETVVRGVVQSRINGDVSQWSDRWDAVLVVEAPLRYYEVAWEATQLGAVDCLTQYGPTGSVKDNQAVVDNVYNLPVQAGGVVPEPAVKNSDWAGWTTDLQTCVKETQRTPGFVTPDHVDPWPAEHGFGTRLGSILIENIIFGDNVVCTPDAC